MFFFLSDGNKHFFYQFPGLLQNITFSSNDQFGTVAVLGNTALLLASEYNNNNTKT